MSKKEINDQTAFETAGIPTPPDQENIAATDTISDAVEAIMDNIKDTISPDDKTHLERLNEIPIHNTKIGGVKLDNKITNDNQILNNRQPNLTEDFGIRTENDEFAKTIMPDAADELDNKTDKKEKRR